MICALALIVGVVGGIYGVGGGSLLAPMLLAAGFSAYEVAPATLLATFLTSIVGIVTFEALQLTHDGGIAPVWILGTSMGLGGFLGSYKGARLQRHIPEASLRRLLGLIACLVAVRYRQTAIQDPPSRAPAPATRIASSGLAWTLRLQDWHEYWHAPRSFGFVER